MLNLQSVFDTELLPTKKLSKKSPYLLEAIQRLQKRNQFKILQNEKVTSLEEIILECFQIATENDKKRGNKNGCTTR